jgi:FkbM family methyltransferase
MRRGATFDVGSLVVENACFEKRVKTVPPCETPSSLATYADWLGLDALREAHGWTGRPDLDRYPSTRDALKESECSGSPACRRAVRWARQPRLGGGCAHVFLDVGANVGLHGRFLYEPELYPENRYHDVFPQVFGPDWRTDKGSACVVAFEPNPRHRAWLTRQAVAYQKRGWRYVAVFAAVGAGASDAKLTFVRPEKGSNNNDWGFSVEWGGASHESGERVEVPFVDLAGFVHHHVGRRAADQRVLMKMDIEGVEYLVLPSLLKTGASRSLDVLTLEKHRAKKVCPLHFLDVVVSHAQCKAMGRAWKSQFEGRGTRLLYLDDESYAADAPRPLPE